MSKILMRVMMVGWIAMLGANAEAHFLKPGNGAAFWCSFCFLLQATEDAKNPVDPISHPEFVQFLVTPKKVELSCNGGTEIIFPSSVQLRLRKEIVRGDITRVINTGLARASLVAMVSHTPLIEDEHCLSGDTPANALIREAGVAITRYACDPDSTPCDGYGEVNNVTCTLPNKYNLNTVFVGALYVCK